MIRVPVDPVRNIKSVVGGKLNDLGEAGRTFDRCMVILQYLPPASQPRTMKQPDMR